METMVAQAIEKEERTTPGSAAKLIREVRRQTHRKFSAEHKIRIVLEGFRKEIPISDLCRRENISSAPYYSWLKDFESSLEGCSLFQKACYCYEVKEREKRGIPMSQTVYDALRGLNKIVDISSRVFPISSLIDPQTLIVWQQDHQHHSKEHDHHRLPQHCAELWGVSDPHLSRSVRQ